MRGDDDTASGRPAHDSSAAGGRLPNAAATAAAATPTAAAASSSDRPFWLEPTARLDGKRGGIFRETLSRPRASLDPMTTRDPTTKALPAGVYGGLVGVIGSTFANQPLLGVQPDLADSWEIQPDGLKYTFQIRPDAMITEPINRPMDSSDVLYSFNHHQGLDGLESARPVRGGDRRLGLSLFIFFAVRFLPATWSIRCWPTSVQAIRPTARCWRSAST